MSITSIDDLNALRKIGKIVADCLAYMAKQLEPGMTAFDLDELGRRYLERFGARSAPKLVYNFPGTTCISVNHEAAHGIPSATKIFRAGDLVNIDVSAELGGFFADTGGSFIIPPVEPVKLAVCEAAKAAMWAGIGAAVHGAKLNRIGLAIETEAKRRGFSVIANLCSHGVGRALHEEPEAIPGIFDPRDRRVLKEGTVITVEPFLSTGAKLVEDSGDGWTLVSPGHFTAQYEHTIVVTRDKPIILTQTA